MAKRKSGISEKWQTHQHRSPRAACANSRAALRSAPWQPNGISGGGGVKKMRRNGNEENGGEIMASESVMAAEYQPSIERKAWHQWRK